tara:strand:+ start:71 stop:1393 length:1323 start_codon:yes stop_codon:yes gene_type:complete
MAMIGSTLDPRLGAVSPAAIQALSQAGAATGQMYQNLGQSIAGVMEDAKDRRISNKMYEALGRSIPDIAEATGVDAKAIGRILDSAKESGLPALRELQDTFTGFIKEGYGRDRDDQSMRERFDHDINKLFVTSDLASQEARRVEDWKDRNLEKVQGFDKLMLDDQQAYSTLSREDQQSFERGERIETQNYNDEQRRKVEDYQTFRDGFLAELKKQDTDNLYGNMLYYATELDKAQANNDIKKAKAILRNQRLVEEEFMGRKTEKSRSLTSKLRNAYNIEEQTARDLAVESITQEFRIHGLSVPNTERMVFSNSDLKKRLTDGAWTKNKIPPALRNVIQDIGDTSAEEQWGRFLLASQGQLFPGNEKENKKYMQNFNERYNIEDSFLQNVAKGTSFFVADMINRVDLFDTFVDDFEHMNRGLTRRLGRTPTVSAESVIDER